MKNGSKELRTAAGHQQQHKTAHKADRMGVGDCPWTDRRRHAITRKKHSREHHDTSPRRHPVHKDRVHKIRTSNCQHSNTSQHPLHYAPPWRPPAPLPATYRGVVVEGSEMKGRGERGKRWNERRASAPRGSDDGAPRRSDDAWSAPRSR